MGILLYDMTMKMVYLLIKFFDDMNLKSCKIDESTFALKMSFELYNKSIRKNYKVSDHKNNNTELVKVSDNYIKQPFDMKTKKAH